MTNEKETIIKSALKYLVKRQIEEGSVGFAVDNDHDHDCCWDDILAWIEAQPCENCISREEAIEKAIDAVDEWDGGCNKRRAEMIEKALKNLPPVTPTSENIKEAYLKGYDYGVKDWFRSKIQPCEDCISRQDVIDLTWDWENFKNITRCDGLDTLRQMRIKVEGLPSVTPKYTDEEIDKAQAVEQAYVDKMVELAVEESKRPKGKWIVISCEPTDIFKCSECGMRVINPYRYCPNCGAEMSGGEEDETDN